LEIALINNMPDSAMEETEAQFAELLGRASNTLPVRIRLFSLPNIPRGDLGRQRLASHYFAIDDLWQNRFDAAIITGTEPRQADLRQEAYWPALIDVMEWAKSNTVSTLMSCLAAHASVLHNDGIQRRALSEKRLGVFEFQTTGHHVLTNEAGTDLRLPHSRWNEVGRRAVEACGYRVLAESKEAGIDLFIKKARKSLLVHFQGHPEYGQLTILREYRRDVRRFLKQERERYPSMPKGYFDGIAIQALSEFQERALQKCSPALMSEFPEALASRNLKKTWGESATNIYRNWLQYVVSHKEERGAMAGFGRARSAAAL
jgi:homoserine O-succinyltransferase